MIFESLSFLPSSVFCHTEGQGAPNSHQIIVQCSPMTDGVWFFHQLILVSLLLGFTMKWSGSGRMLGRGLHTQEVNAEDC